MDGSAVPDARTLAALAAARGRVSMLAEVDGTLHWVSPSIEAMMGWSPAELVGTSLFDLYQPESRAYSVRGFEGVRRDPAGASYQLGAISRTAHVRCKDGMVLGVESRPSVIMRGDTVDGVLVEWVPVPDRSWLLTAIDAVTLRRPLSETLHAVVALVESLLTGVEVGVAVCDAGRWTMPVVPGDRAADSLVAHLPAPSDDRWDDGFVLLSDDGEVAAWAGMGLGVGVTPLLGPDRTVLGAMVLLHARADRLPIVVVGGENLYEVAVRLAALTVADSGHRAELRAAAELDPLTGLLNRAGLRRAVAQLPCSPEQQLAVLYLDLDDFKPINDHHGHAAGDDVLTAIGTRLRTLLRGTDVVARLGGDEFVVLSVAAWTRDGLDGLTTRIIDAIRRPLDVHGELVAVDVSLGVAVGDPAAADRLLADADHALLAAKREGKARVVVDACPIGKAPSGPSMTALSAAVR